MGYAAAIPEYSSNDPLYGVYLEDGIDGVVNYSLANAATSGALAAKKGETDNENASLTNMEIWNSMQELGLDDQSLVDTYLSKNSSDDVAARVNDAVGADGVIAYRNAYDGADTDGNGKVSENELRLALINSGLDDDLLFSTYMAVQTTTGDDGKQNTDEKAATAYQQFGTSGGADWLEYYSAYSVLKQQEKERAAAAGESAEYKNLAIRLLNQLDLTDDERRLFFSLTNGTWKGNPF